MVRDGQFGPHSHPEERLYKDSFTPPPSLDITPAMEIILTRYSDQCYRCSDVTIQQIPQPDIINSHL